MGFSGVARRLTISLVILFSLTACSARSSEPDPSLTYAIASSNWTQHQGKRVRWTATRVGVVISSDGGKTTAAMIWGVRGDGGGLFATEESDEQQTDAWKAQKDSEAALVTGTISGKEVDFNQGSRGPIKVRMLTNAIIDVAEPSK